MPSPPFDVRPVVIGVHNHATLGGLKAVIRVDGAVTLAGSSGPLDLFRPTRVELARSVGVKPAFFRDTRLVGTITVRPDSDRSPVVGSVQRVEYILVAPFKRLLFYLSIAVCSIAAVFLLVRVWRRLTTLEYTEISSPRVC